VKQRAGNKAEETRDTMPKVTFVTHDGVSTTVEEPNGVSVMQAAQNAGIGGIVAECGGSMMCATCHVYVAEPWLSKLPEMTATESEMLTMTVSERRATSRLSCQIVLGAALDGITVALPEKQI
jgi:ferredoxin, 2Fe-2S